jgi:CRISPR/Cas system-associated exonuclease Cas4 (RecB family)
VKLDIKHLSASSILLYSKCPYSFYLKNTIQEDIEESKAQLSGSIFHRIIELRLNGCSKEEAVGIATQEFLTKPYFAEALKDALEFYFTYEPHLQDLLNEGVIATEKEFALEIDNIIIKGYIDVITAKRRMIDLKTSRRNGKPLPDFKHVFQMSVYALTCDADTYHLHYIFPNYADLIQVKPLPMKEVLSIIQSVAKMIETQEFPPIGLLTSYCQFCQYKKHCKYHRLTEKPSGGIIERKEEAP